MFRDPRNRESVRIANRLAFSQMLATFLMLRMNLHDSGLADATAKACREP